MPTTFRRILHPFDFSSRTGPTATWAPVPGSRSRSPRGSTRAGGSTACGREPPGREWRRGRWWPS